MTIAKVQIAPSKRSWRLVASNGEIIASSEQYATKWGCKHEAGKIARTIGVPLYGVND